MIAINHPALGAALTQDPLARERMPIVLRPIGPVVLNPIHSVATPAPPAPAPVAIAPGSDLYPMSPVPSTSSSAPSGSLPIQVSSIVDPVTGVVYAGYLTPDAQALYQSGSLLTGGNQLTPQGSALAAQGDLITGTPAPSAAQIAQASTATTAAASTGTDWMSWLGEETLISGYPNGLIAAGAVSAAAWFFGGKKRRR